MAAPTPTEQLKIALDWIGISDQAHRDRFILEFVSTASDFKLSTVLSKVLLAPRKTLSTYLSK